MATKRIDPDIYYTPIDLFEMQVFNDWITSYQSYFNLIKKGSAGMIDMKVRETKRSVRSFYHVKGDEVIRYLKFRSRNSLNKIRPTTKK